MQDQRDYQKKVRILVICFEKEVCSEWGDDDNDCTLRDGESLPDITQCFALSKMEMRNHLID